MTSVIGKALRAGHCFDGAQVRGPVTVLIDNGRIVDVDYTSVQPPHGYEVTDFGAQAWLLPGLIDCHVHLAWDATSSAVTNLIEADDERLLANVARAATSALRAGITTVRDLGDRDYVALRFARRTPEHAVPEIVAAGPPITTTNGHTAFLGGIAEGREALRVAVRERYERGCRVVKVMASGGTMTPGSLPHEPQYGFVDLAAIVAEARRYGMTTAAHAHARQSVHDAVEAGFDTIEHFTLLTEDGVEFEEELLYQVVERGTYVSLTVGSLPGVSDSRLPPVLAQRMDALVEVFRKVIASGARVVAGTDAGIEQFKPHDVLSYGLERLQAWGMPTDDVLRSATSVAADAIGMRGRKGMLRRGTDADVLVLGSDPVADLAATRDVVAVFRAGQRVLLS